MKLFKRIKLLHFYYFVIPNIAIISIVFSFFYLIPPKEIHILSGPKGGFFSLVSEELKEELNKYSIKVTIDHTEYTTNIVERLNTKNGNRPHLGFLAQDISDKYYPNVYSLGAVAIEPLWIFTDATRNINDIRQLKGLSLAVGPKGSGVRRISEKVLKFYGIDETNTKFIEIQILEAEKALINRRIDAAFFLLPARTPVVKNLAARPTLKLLNISESEALSHFIDPLEHVIVPKGAFKISPLIPHKNLDAIALPISIIISDNAGMGLGALVAAILKDKYPRQTFYNIDEDLPKFSYQGIKRLSAAEEIYQIGLPYLTEVFGLKYGLVLAYAFKPIVYIFVSTVLFIGVMNTYFNLVPIWSGITALFNSKRP